MKTILIIFLALVHTTIYAQNWHVAGKLGVGNYKGDIKTNGAKLAWGIGAKYDVSEHIVARAIFNKTVLQGNDAKSSNAAQLARNLTFTAKLKEVEIAAQYQIFSLNDKWWTPYVFIGGSIYGAKPYTTDALGNKTYLQPLGTEGQGIASYGKKYKTSHLALVYGVGGEYALGEDVKVGIEAGFRYTGNDYIDDVSTTYADYANLLLGNGVQAASLAYRGSGTYPAAGTARGNSGDKDKFYFINLIVTVRPFVNQWKRTTITVFIFSKAALPVCPMCLLKSFTYKSI
jgi:hypothetical protein